MVSGIDEDPSKSKASSVIEQMVNNNNTIQQQQPDLTTCARVSVNENVQELLAKRCGLGSFIGSHIRLQA